MRMKRIRETQKSNGATRSGDVTGTDVGGGGEWQLRRAQGWGGGSGERNCTPCLVPSTRSEDDGDGGKRGQRGEHGGGTNT